jgi:hypothetical protein
MHNMDNIVLVKKIVRRSVIVIISTIITTMHSIDEEVKNHDQIVFSSN